MSEEVLQSTTTKVKSPKGFEWLFNMKFETVKEAIKNMDLIEEKFTEAGWTPVLQTRGGFPKKEIKYVEGKQCPLCQGRVVEAKKKDGSPFHKCEHQKYINGQASGCTYVDWLNTPKTPEY